MDTEDYSLFGVFDGHGGREVAVYCQNHYEGILKNQRELMTKEGVETWLKQSFLKVDDELRTDTG
jgi:protein phosphatase 1G